MVDERIEILIPTGPNMIVYVNENIVDNLRNRHAGSVTLPSLYERAKLIVNETGDVAVIRRRGRR